MNAIYFYSCMMCGKVAHTRTLRRLPALWGVTDGGKVACHHCKRLTGKPRNLSAIEIKQCLADNERRA